jgi:uncharacterized glyoxalase superfamily protein PhnB
MQSIFPVLKYDDARAAIEFLEGEQRFNQGAGRYSLYVAVDDPDAHHARAKEVGATIERELSDRDYGSREYTARDPEGNLWSFGTYRPGAS